LQSSQNALTLSTSFMIDNPQVDILGIGTFCQREPLGPMPA
jgi:hypothetical protein